MIKRKKILSILSVALLTFLLIGSMIFVTMSTIKQNIENTHFSVSQNASESYEEQRAEIVAPDGYEVQLSYLDVLNSYYEQFCTYCETSGLNVQVMSFAEFSDGFYEQEVMSITEYLSSLVNYVDSFFYKECNTSDILNLNEIQMYSPGSSSGDDDWYFNTSESLPSRATFGTYDFSGVAMGDILYENSDGDVTGHIAIVEGRYYDSAKGVTYTRTLEAIKKIGVCRGVVDDSRFLGRKGTFYRVPTASNVQKQDAVNFCIEQYGKPWKLQLNKPLSSDYWQCSTLVWAAYKNQGIDIEQKGAGSGVGITPHDIRDASTTLSYLSY